LLTAWDDNVVCFWFECCVRHFTTMSLLFIIFYSLEDSLEVLGDDKCFVVVYFELTKIGIVLPFYFLLFTFYFYTFFAFLYCSVLLVLCVMSYCDTVVCVSRLCLSLILILVILWHVSYPAANGLILDWWNISRARACVCARVCVWERERYCRPGRLLVNNMYDFSNY
jgi:hypothetical protein